LKSDGISRAVKILPDIARFDGQIINLRMKLKDFMMIRAVFEDQKYGCTTNFNLHNTSRHLNDSDNWNVIDRSFPAV
jgi:hypothetical protein